MRRTLNLKILAILLVFVALAAGGIYAVHGLQIRRNSASLLDQAKAYQKDGKLDEAAEYLERYLGLMPGDTEALTRYGLLLDDIAIKKPIDTVERDRAREQSYLILDRVLAVMADEEEKTIVQRRAAEAAVEVGIHNRTTARIGWFQKAEDHLKALLEGKPNDGELEELSGEALIGLGEDRKAAEAFGRAIQHAPSRIKSYERLAALLRSQLDDAERADATMDSAVAANGRSAEAYLARWRYRRAFNLAGGADDAAKALELAPEEPGALMAAAEAARLSGAPDRARTLLERGLKLQPKAATWYLALAELEAQAGRTDAAIARLRAGLEVVEVQANLNWVLADLLITAGDLDEAAKLVDALRRDTGTVREPVDYLEGRLLGVKRRWVEASERLAKAAPRLSDQPELAVRAYLLLAECYRQLGQPDALLVAYRHAYDLSPSSQPIRRGLAEALAENGQLDEALRIFRIARTEVPSARLDEARLLIDYERKKPGDRSRADEIDRALGDAERLLPNSAEVTILRAQTLASRGQYDQAVEVVRKAREAHPDQVELWTAGAVLAERGSKPDEALALLDQARTQLGDLVDLRLARAQYWLRHPDGATVRNLEALTQGTDDLPVAERDRLQDALAGAFLRAGEPGRAVQLWGEVIKRAPNNLDLRLAMLDAARAAGDAATADRQLEEIRRIEGPEGIFWRFAEAFRLVNDKGRGDAESLKRARALLAEVEERRPGWHRTALTLAQIAEREGNAELAIEHYLAAIDKGERQPVTIRHVAQLLNQQGKFAEIDRVVRKMEQDGPLTPGLTRLAAELSLQSDESERTLALARQSVPEGSKDPGDHVWLGGVLWASGRPKEAEAELRLAVSLGKGSPEPWLALVQFLAQSGRGEEAEGLIAEAERALPPDRAPLALAQCYAAIGKAEKAAARFRAALEAKPADVRTLRAAADFYLRIGQMRAAEPILNTLIDPRTEAPRADARWARRRLALAMAPNADEARFAKALALIDENLREDGDSPPDRRARVAILAMHPDHRAEAVEVLSKGVVDEAMDASDQLLLAQLHKANGDWPAAKRQMLSLLTAQPKNARLVVSFAEDLISHGDLDDAETWLKRLEEIAPKALETTALKARLLARRDKPKEAVALLEQDVRARIAAAGTDPAVRAAVDQQVASVAALLEKLGQYEAAEAMYRTYVERAGASRPESTLILAAYLGRRGQTAKALDTLDPCWESCPFETVAEVSTQILSSPNADASAYERAAARIEAGVAKAADPTPLLFHLANLWSLRGDYRRAEDAYRRIAANRSDLSAPMNNLAWLLAVGGGDGREALEQIERAIALDGLQPDMLDTRALVYLSQGRPGDAIKDLQRALASARTPALLAHLAMCQAAAGDAGAALESLNQANQAGFRLEELHPLERKIYDRLLGPLTKR